MSDGKMVTLRDGHQVRRECLAATWAGLQLLDLEAADALIGIVITRLPASVLEPAIVQQLHQAGLLLEHDRLDESVRAIVYAASNHDGQAVFTYPVEEA